MKASFKSILCVPLFSSEMPVKTSHVIYLSLIIITITSTVSLEKERKNTLYSSRGVLIIYFMFISYCSFFEHR